jgi:hypothetical protein
VQVGAFLDRLLSRLNLLLDRQLVRMLLRSVVAIFCWLHITTSRSTPKASGRGR